MDFVRTFPDKPGYYFVKFNAGDNPLDSPTEIVELEHHPENAEDFTKEEMEEDYMIEERCWEVWRCGNDTDYRETFLWGERIELP
jgi:hypothetical protein